MTKDNSFCPVPLDQIPINEYKKLQESIFLNWPLISKSYFYRKLFYSWLIALPLIAIISSGSVELINLPLKLITVSLIWSLIIPIIITIRYSLSWNYIYKRLRSEKIEYEESGWYDGQIWEKNIEMRQKDILAAEYEIKPILDILRQSLINILITFF